MYSWTVSRVHLIFGIVIAVVFLLTGALLRIEFPDKQVMSQELRVLARSRHIYILFSALLHLLLGIVVFKTQKQWQNRLRTTGSLFLFASSLLLVAAFGLEVFSYAGFSILSALGIYFCAGGTLAHVIATVVRSKR